VFPLMGVVRIWLSETTTTIQTKSSSDFPIVCLSMVIFGTRSPPKKSLRHFLLLRPARETRCPSSSRKAEGILRMSVLDDETFQISRNTQANH